MLAGQDDRINLGRDGDYEERARADALATKLRELGVDPAKLG